MRRQERETLALDGLSFSVASGEIFGVLGPNGAGKTTLIKILTTLLLPTSGSARVLGHDVVTDATWVRRNIGFTFGGDRGLYYRLSGRDNLTYFGTLYQVEPTALRARIPQALDLVGLRERADERVQAYSRGMKQRLHVARALLHGPRVLFLDEPTIGLDPVAARDLRALIRTLQAQGVTVVLTTHYMFEADALCDRIAVIKAGRVVALGSPQQLKDRVNELSVVEIELYGDAATALDRLRTLDVVESVGVESRDLKHVLSVQTRSAQRSVSACLAVLSDLEIGRVALREATLEDAYVQLVGRVE